MSIEELVDTSCGTIVEELSAMSFKELQKVNRGITTIQNLVSELMAEMILNGEAD